MKSTLLLITLLFSLNAFGAIKYSDTGLEGWGKKGVMVRVIDYSKRDKNFPLKSIKTKVELRLLQAGIKINDKFTGHDIVINAQPINVGGRIVGYAVVISARRPMQFQALDNTGKLVTYGILANSRTYGGGCGASDLITFIDSSMDNFLLDHLKANPKK